MTDDEHALVDAIEQDIARLMADATEACQVGQAAARRLAAITDELERLAARYRALLPVSGEVIH
jgi:hypothetical protein